MFIHAFLAMVVSGQEKLPTGGQHVAHRWPSGAGRQWAAQMAMRAQTARILLAMYGQFLLAANTMSGIRIKKRVPFRMLDDSPALAQGTNRSLGLVTRPTMPSSPSIHDGTVSFQGSRHLASKGCWGSGAPCAAASTITSPSRRAAERRRFRGRCQGGPGRVNFPIHSDLLNLGVASATPEPVPAPPADHSAKPPAGSPVGRMVGRGSGNCRPYWKWTRAPGRPHLQTERMTPALEVFPGAMPSSLQGEATVLPSGPSTRPHDR